MLLLLVILTLPLLGFSMNGLVYLVLFVLAGLLSATNGSISWKDSNLGRENSLTLSHNGIGAAPSNSSPRNKGISSSCQFFMGYAMVIVMSRAITMVNFFIYVQRNFSVRYSIRL